MNSIHELLPWYLNKTLAPEETAAFEEHLSRCATCRRELAVLEKMQNRLQRHGEAVLSDHPSPEELVAALAEEDDDSEPAPEAIAEVRRHIALCATCADEANWVLREAGPPAPGAVPATWKRLLPWALPVAALLLLALAVPIATSLGGGTGTTGIVTPHLVEATERAGGDRILVQVLPGSDTIHLIFPVDQEPGTSPLLFEVMDAGGEILHRDDDVSRDDLYRGLFLFFSMRRDECPDGDYTARLSPAEGNGTATEYPFRVVTESR